MARLWIIVIFISLLGGCGGSPGRMEHPEDPQGRYRDQIAVAKRLLQQKENWAERADWEVVDTGDGWKVLAWRIERPERKGPDRYLPWGYSIIQLDRRMIAVDYQNKG